MLAIDGVIAAFVGFPSFAGDGHEVVPFSAGLNVRSSPRVADPDPGLSAIREEVSAGTARSADEPKAQARN